MDYGLILEKPRGLSAKSAKLDRGLISKKHRGFFAKWRGILVGIYFSTNKAVDRVHASVDRPGVLGPPWIHRGADRCWGHGTAARSPELGIRPLRCAKAHRRGRNREERTGSSARASPGLGWRRGGRATAVKARGRCSLFIGGRGSAGEGWPGSLTLALMALTPLKTGEI
jgi:hypothetical protein